MTEPTKDKLESQEEFDRRTAIATGTMALMGFYLQACKTGGKSSDADGATSGFEMPGQGPTSVGDGIKQNARGRYMLSCQKVTGNNRAIGLSVPFSASMDGKSYDIVFIGSGYGSATVAARVSAKAKAGVKMAMFERGKEWRPGDFPDTALKAAGELRSPLNPWGLMNYIPNKDVDLVSANGLGGTSLINAGIAIKPTDQVFEQIDWPEHFRKSKDNREKYFGRAWEVLRPVQSPFTSPKATRIKEAGAKIGGKYRKLDITIADKDGVNPQGMDMSKCIGCGDCFGGCNVGAKGSLNTSYLPMARKNGVEIYTQADVQFISKVAGGYEIHVRHRDSLILSVVKAKSIVLGAGTLGTNNILLSSKNLDRKFSFSNQLGRKFSANGDVVGFTKNVQEQSNAGGPGLDNLNDQNRVGPVVESVLDFRTGDLKEQIALVDACAPSNSTLALAPILTTNGMPDKNLSHGFLYLVLNHDGGNGTLMPNIDGMARVKIDNYENRYFAKHAEGLIKKVSEAIGGEFVANPRSGVAYIGDKVVGFREGGALASVHPLGGCSIGDSHKIGAANFKGQIYDANGGLHKGLFVADGSAVPTSLGIHPFLTITAIAECVAEHMVADNEQGFFNA